MATRALPFAHTTDWPIFLFFQKSSAPLTLSLSHLIGQNGQNGSDLNMNLMGLDMNADAMSIEVTDRGKSKSVVSFNTANQFVLFRAAGGDAGDGGRGGKGGTGGEDTCPKEEEGICSVP